MKQKRVSDYKDKIFRHKLTVVYKTILVIVLCAVVLTGVKIYRDNQVYHSYEVVQATPRVGTYVSIFQNYQGNMLVYSKDGISAYDKKGNQLWNQTYEMQEPVVRTNGAYVTVCDYQGSVFYVMDQSGPVTSVETNMQILEMAVSESGVIGAALLDDDVVLLKLYTKSGDLISEIKTTMRQSGYPVSFAISPDNIKVAVSYLKPEGGRINSSLAFYNFGGVGQNETDNLVSGYDYEDQIFPLVVYPNETTAVAAGDRNILLMKGKQKPTLDKEIALEEEISAFYYNETNLAIVSRDHEQAGAYDVTVYDMNGKKQLSQKIDFAYKDIIVEDHRIIIYNEARVMVLGLNGVTKYDGDIGGNIQALIPLGADNEFLGVFEDGIRLIKLR